MNTPLPLNFIENIKKDLGDEALELINALEQSPVTSVRLNKRKPGAQFDYSDHVPWCESGFYLSKRPEFILDPLLHSGCYYVQDASSMIYQEIMARLVDHFLEMKGKNVFSLKEDIYLKVLDMCAAPGGKTTAMINALPDECEIIANEYTSKRLGALKENLERWGFENVRVTNHDSSFFAQGADKFDVVAVDAPCSGEGMMRKEEIARKQWSLELVNKCSVLQREILDNAVLALKEGGFLIYSTCTFNRQENEENTHYIVEKLGLHPKSMNFPEEWGISGGIKTDLPVYRFMPHKTKGEGLFVGVFQKDGEWHEDKAPIKLSRQKNSDEYPLIDVDKPTAVAYLRGESIVLPPESPLGMVTIGYRGYALGSAKNIGKRANNLYPKNKRILKRW